MGILNRIPNRNVFLKSNLDVIIGDTDSCAIRFRNE